jgi:deaminated glutathione amidase
MVATPLKVALAQYSCDCDPVQIIAEAKRQHAEIIVFPEMFSNGHASFDANDSAARELWQHKAKAIDGPYIARFRQAAQDSAIYVVATLLEASAPKPFNSAVLIAPNGEMVLHPRKVYICDFDVPELACGRGHEFCAAKIRTSAGPVKVGIMICMDREFPEAARSLSRAGAEFALVPNCCILATDRVQGDVRIAQARGRAFEMVMGIAVANYPSPRADGHSFAADPNGTVIAMADDGEGLTIATFDLALIQKMRKEDRFRWCVE